ncbi:MAG: 4Fe-4S binding protein [Deferribacteraceae bacterium]|jgi:polyferredoxin|nr:4Fe-4S binding protein [Deferribacteraceae bacterium]
MKKKTNYLIKRRVVYFLIVFLFFTVPFINIDGLPLIRFDLSAMTIYFAGGIVKSSHIFTVLLVTFALLFFFIYATQVFGRIWCGWLCPQAISLEIIPIKDTRKKSPKIYCLKKISFALIFAFLATCGTVRYTMDFNTFITRLASGTIHFAWWFLTLFILFFILWGRKFCTTVCPYSMLQSIMFDNDTLRIGVIPERAGDCIHCSICGRVCPAGIDIRDGLSSKCVSCAACVDACSGIMARKNKLSLVGYFFGSGKFRPFKVNKLITLIIALCFIIFSVVAFLGIKELKVAVAGQSRSDVSGKTRYTLSLNVENVYDDNLFIQIYNDENLITDFTLPRKDSKMVDIEFEAEGSPNLRARALRGRVEEWVKIRLKE